MSEALSALQPALKPAGFAGVNQGPRGWLRAYGLMVRWEMLSLRLLIPIMIVVQFFVGAGTVVGLGFFYPEIPPLQALYVSTGAAVVALLMLGLVMAPQTVSQHRMEGTYDFIWTLPVPRFVTVLAGLTVWMTIAVPGMVAALGVAVLRYDLTLEVSPLIVPATLMTVAMSSSLGYAFAHGIPNPLAVNLLTQILIFVIIMYSPINFPADRFPTWLDDLHAVLPFEHAANVVRAGLTEGIVEHVGRSFAILGAWVAGGAAVTAWVLGRRR